MKMSNQEKRNSKTTWKEWKQEKIRWIIKPTEEKVVHMGSMSKIREESDGCPWWQVNIGFYQWENETSSQPGQQETS